MDKNSLPKLETDGFTYEQKRKRQSASKLAGDLMRIARVAGNNIKKFRSEGSKGKADRCEPDIKYRRFMFKTGACAVIAVVILGIASVDSPDTKSITQALNGTQQRQFNMDEDIGRLKFVNTLGNESQSVFSSSPAGLAVYPAEGDIVTAFGQSGSQGVRIKPVNAKAVSISKGSVGQTGEINGEQYIKITLDTGEAVFYYGINPVVKVHDIVTAGQQVGDITGDYLYIEIRDKDKYIDPITFIEQQQSAAVNNAS